MSVSARPCGAPDLPPGWERERVWTVGPFVTAQLLRRPDGSTVLWRSRTHRKARPERAGATHVWWQPQRIGWWIALLFAVGSSCFLVAAVASQVSTPGSWIAPTYFIGSLFFTTAAYLQHAEAADAGRRSVATGARLRRRPASWDPRRIDWLASIVQLVGTLFFNVSTFAALAKGLDTTQVNRRVWAPDALGSICFLVASELAFAEICHRWASLRGRTLSWWIAALNLGGSIAFGVSAIAALVLPASGEPLNAALSNVTTALGALGFLVGAILLVPESRRQDAAGVAYQSSPTSTGSGTSATPKRS